MLAESQPPHQVSGDVLRQWYTKYHPDSGPVTYSTAEELEREMGDHLRATYPDMSYRPLHNCLGKRAKAVVVSHNVVEKWVQKCSSTSASSSSAPAAAKAKAKAGAAPKARGK